VVLLHGSGSTRSATLEHAAVLAGHGYGALLLDARGHGRSGGRAMDLGWQGDADVTAALDWLEVQPEVAPGTRFVLAGLSMGGEEAIGAAAADERVAGVVAEGATGRVAADRAWLSDAYGLRGSVQELLERAQEAVVDVLTDASPPRSLRSAASAAGVPMLLIAAGDVADEALAAEHIAEGSDRVEVWVVPGGDHTGALATAPEAWEDRVVALIERTTAG
jgi:pimeloyl-ACP methyl ester carboxylesterase